MINFTYGSLKCILYLGNFQSGVPLYTKNAYNLVEFFLSFLVRTPTITKRLIACPSYIRYSQFFVYIYYSFCTLYTSLLINLHENDILTRRSLVVFSGDSGFLHQKLPPRNGTLMLKIASNTNRPIINNIYTKCSILHENGIVYIKIIFIMFIIFYFIFVHENCIFYIKMVYFTCM